jgi:site-specific DNA recombinase
MSRSAANGTRRTGTIRCAVYTRKSSEEGLDQEFNSLQAQRERARLQLAERLLRKRVFFN